MLAYFLDDFDPFIFHVYGNYGPRWYGFAYVMACPSVSLNDSTFIDPAN